MRAVQERRRSACATRLLPRAALILSLIVYALLGAALFHAIEGPGREPRAREPRAREDGQYRDFVRALVDTVRNHSAGNETELVEAVRQKITKDYKAVWSQSPTRWHFFGSLFFCCTVFTTVGYGEIYPVTLAGKVVCILYSMVGIPLMLLVITDVGDVLAVLFSNSYRRLHSSCKRLLSRIWNPREKPQEFSTIHDGTYVFRQDVAVQEAPDDHRLTIHMSLKQKADQLRSNVKTFDRIVAREEFRQKSPLARSCSCPQLNQMPPPPVGFNINHFMSIGQKMDRFNVPFLVILLVVFAYMLIWALILPIWEDELTKFDAFYFCFITLTTIGFGDIVPKHPKFFMLTFLFIIMGMAIMSMAFKLGQSRIVSCYHRLMHCLGRVGKYDVLNQIK